MITTNDKKNHNKFIKITDYLGLVDIINTDKIMKIYKYNNGIVKIIFEDNNALEVKETIDEIYNKIYE